MIFEQNKEEGSHFKIYSKPENDSEYYISGDLKLHDCLKDFKANESSFNLISPTGKFAIKIYVDANDSKKETIIIAKMLKK